MIVIIKSFKLDKLACTTCHFKNFWSDIFKFLKYALPSAGMLALDQINFEITQIEANYLGIETQAAHVAVANTVTCIYMIPSGLGIALASIVGNYVGAGNEAKAKMYAQAGCLLFFFTNFPIEVLIVMFREPLSKLYTYDEKTAEIISNLLVVVMVFNAIDFFHIVLCGVLKGIAKQDFAFLLILISYYIFGIPFGYVAAFIFGWDIYGIWAGLALGALTAALTLT